MNRDYTQFPDDDNGNVLWQLRSQGDRLCEPREVDFSAIFATEEAALSFAVVCLQSGFKVELDQLEESEDGLVWYVTIYTDIIPTHADITSLESSLMERATALGGRSDGWSAIVISDADSADPD